MEGMKEVRGWPVRFKKRQDFETRKKINDDTAHSLDWIANNNQSNFKAIDKQYVYYGFPTHESQLNFLHGAEDLLAGIGAVKFKVEAINHETILGYEQQEGQKNI